MSLYYRSTVVNIGTAVTVYAEPNVTCQVGKYSVAVNLVFGTNITNVFNATLFAGASVSYCGNVHLNTTSE
jgi:hypothetical protein